MQKCLTPFFIINHNRTFVTSWLQTKLVFSKVMLNIEQFVVDESYAEAKVLDSQGDTININIQGGLWNLSPRKSLRINGDKIYAYLITKITVSGKLVARKLPILGVKD